jgi:hypothetical protein
MQHAIQLGLYWSDDATYGAIVGIAALLTILASVVVSVDAVAWVLSRMRTAEVDP